MKIERFILLLALTSYLSPLTSYLSPPLQAQEVHREAASEKEKIVVVGSIEHDGLYAFEDKAIGATKPDFPYLSNSYLDLGIRSRYVSAGLRVELNLAPLPGYDSGFKGAGVSNFYVKGECRYGAITIGDVYAQFGSGFILRLYEDRGLGLDNSLRGAKIDLTPYKGIRLQLLGGKQRRYWQMYDDKAWGFNYSRDAVLGADLELDIDEWSPRLQQAGATLMFGASWVSKYQRDDTIIAHVNIQDGYQLSDRYNLPLWVGAMDVRAQFQMKGWSALIEYAFKANDPTWENKYSYHPGHTFYASLSYSRSGFSVLLQARRAENMSFRSDRMASSVVGQLNHLPAFAYQHTYTLTSLNAYSTQLTSEWAFQGEVAYTFKRNTKMGGKYGTTLKLHASHIRGLDNTPYHTDVHLELNKKLTREWSLNAMLMYQYYNTYIVEGHGEPIQAGIAVADVKWALHTNVQMRAELQYLYSRDDEGQWLFALYELSLFHKLQLTLSDMYNIGGVADASHEHYWEAAAAFSHKAHRLSLGYKRSIAGFNCSGGVCRYFPAQKGFVLSYNFSW